MTAANTPWYEANHRYLVTALGLLRARLERRGEENHLAEIAASMTAPPAIEMISGAFGLSPFERDTLLLCAGVALDAGFGQACAAAQGDARHVAPTFSLALDILENPHWSALSPAAPLRRWRLIEPATGETFALSPLRIDERILHYLAGVSYLDERLAGLVRQVEPPGELPFSHASLAQRLASDWASGDTDTPRPIFFLFGDDAESRRAIASAACARVGLSLLALDAGGLPTNRSDLDAFARLVEREAILSAGAVVLEWESSENAEAASDGAVVPFIELLRCPLMVSSSGRRALRIPSIAVDVARPTVAEQRQLWENVLGPSAPQLNGNLEVITSQFNLSSNVIRSAGAQALAQMQAGAEEPGGVIWEAIWEACRRNSRPRLEDLTQRIDPAAHWDDLVLPEPQRAILQEIALHVRKRATVYNDWGFASKGSRGLGISALFAGASGTGKTMAAEVLANELRLDLFRIDLSQVVSKYIGETEKNLRRVFDAAEDGGAILLFDEADALFGRRSEVKDSHDRYANIEISYLLQRMEAYRGLAILTTNLKNALDTGFLRRLRFIVQFPFPDASLRSEIWRRIFPEQTPVAGLDFTKLARMNIAGGNIRNIAMNAAFLAAGAGEPVRMDHLLQAARGEYAKLEKPLSDAETGGWI